MPRGDIAALAAAHAEKSKQAAFKPLFTPVPEDRCLSMGCSILNLAMSGRVNGGAKLGSTVHIPGDSDTAKSLIGRTILAEATIDKRFDKHSLYLDNADSPDSFPIQQMFGKKLAERMKHPGPDGGSSPLIEDFFFNAFRIFSKEEAIYLLDSMDGLEARAGMELFVKNLDLHAKGKELKQSMGMNKAKSNSENLRKLIRKIEETRSLLIIISQSRANCDPHSMSPRVHSGGWALKFWSTYQIWLTPMGKLYKTIHGGKHSVGTLVQVKLVKNHVTGKEINFDMSLYYGYGIADEETSVNWLCDPDGGGVWKQEKGNLTTRGETGLPKTVSIKEFLAKTSPNSPQYDPVARKSFDVALQLAWDELEAQVRRAGRYGNV